MKKHRLLLSFCVMLAALLLPMSAFAQSSLKYNQYDYYISSYDVAIDVGEDNILHVTENITAFFNVKKHGIYRTIPYDFTVRRADGSTAHAKVKLTNISCDSKFDIERSDGICTIKIGDSHTTLTGEQSYSISYDYNIGMDLLDDADELYYNIIGDAWETVIENVTFTIHMPKAFDSAKVGFSTGYAGSTGSDKVSFDIDGNTISGRLKGALYPYEAATIRVELPDGYFVFDDSEQNVFIAFMIILPLLSLAFVFIIWAKYGNDRKVIETVEFYPPDNMGCLDVAHWYNGVLRDSDVVALLFELANEGYIAIFEDRTDGYRIKKLKNYSGKDSAKTIFMSGLFKHGDVTYKRKLENEFYTYIDKIKSKYNTQKKRTAVFENRSLVLRVVSWVVVIVCFLLSLLIHENAYSTDLANIAFAAGIAVYVASFIMAFFVRKRTDEGHTMLERIKGFKSFLETAEKERLEQLVEECPEYFYNILPYTYVLGVSDKWVKKFEGISIEPPDWYYGTGPYNRMMMLHFIHNTYNNCSKTMQSRPSSDSSSGGFGGGGISGGGFGGGGGGSW